MTKQQKRQAQALGRLEAAAFTWWLGRRPDGWDATAHHGNPTINCIDIREHDLALALAAVLDANRELTT